jgi:hypothetical protein
LTDVVVLPTPPFWLAMAIIRDDKLMLADLAFFLLYNLHVSLNSISPVMF